MRLLTNNSLYYNERSALAGMSDRLAKTDMGRKEGVPLSGGAGSPSNTMWRGPRPNFIPSSKNWVLCPFRGAWFPSNTVARTEAYLHTKWHLDPSSRLATTDMGQKFGAVPL